MSDSSSSSDASVSSAVDDEPPEDEQPAGDSEHEASGDAEEEEEAEEENDEVSKQSADNATPEAPSENEADGDDDDDDGNDDEDEDEDDEAVVSRKHKRPKKTDLDATDLFGELSDDDDENKDEAKDDDEEPEAEADEDDAERAVEGDEQEAEQEEGAEAEEGEGEPVIERLIKVDMPSMRFDLGNDLFYVRLPNFLSIDPKPFDPETYEAEGAGEEVLDEEGRTRLKMTVENTIRWQYVHDTTEDGTEQVRRISNARVVRWSDGSMSLHLGPEIFDIHAMSEQQDYNHMYVKQGNGLVGQAVFKRKLNFRPHSTDSLTHRKMTLSMADKTKRVQQVKEMHLGKLKNPEMGKAQLIKQEEDALKATVRRETQQRRVRDRFSVRSLEEGMGGEDDEGAISLSSIKRRVMTKPRTSFGSNTDIVDDDYSSSSNDEQKAASDNEDEDEVGTSSLSASAKAKKRRLVVSDD